MSVQVKLPCNWSYHSMLQFPVGNQYPLTWNDRIKRHPEGYLEVHSCNLHSVYDVHQRYTWRRRELICSMLKPHSIWLISKDKTMSSWLLFRFDSLLQYKGFVWRILYDTMPPQCVITETDLTMITGKIIFSSKNRLITVQNNFNSMWYKKKASRTQKAQSLMLCRLISQDDGWRFFKVRSVPKLLTMASVGWEQHSRVWWGMEPHYFRKILVPHTKFSHSWRLNNRCWGLTK